MTANQFSATGQFTTLDNVPSATATGILGINGGEIVGVYMSADTVLHGFVLSDGQFTTIDAPAGATSTLVTGIDSRGEIVGRYQCVPRFYPGGLSAGVRSNPLSHRTPF